MEQTQVIIVGAGPSGLVLGLALAKHRVRSVILEKETEITTDPRGVYLTGDAIRILHDLGIGDEINKIGHVVDRVNLHQSNLNTKPFFSMYSGSSSALHQALPEALLQIQPRLESALRQEVEQSSWCTLRTGCTVVDRSCEDPPTIEYTTDDSVRHQIGGEWLIGADGKLGIVRKHFLEPTAGIKQLEGLYPYDGTWIAANLRITAPTPQTHPDFPLWVLGLTPDDIYDLYWPKGWHFCCPPGKATAAGRFGPHSERLWRHEFRQDWDDSMDAEELLWEHIKPMITRNCDEDGRKFANAVQYPVDCVEILRCRPFRFTHKVVNRWFHKRTILIGDAAHVFPPFAGQGIASGTRDAHQLAWRLALLMGSGLEKPAFCDSILGAWALERRQSVDTAARISMYNGKMCNNEPKLWLRLLIWVVKLVESIPFLPNFPDPQGVIEKKGFTALEKGFLMKDRNGGARLAQIYVQSASERRPILSDRLLHKSDTLFTVLVITPGEDHKEAYADAEAVIEAALIDPSILSTKSIVVFDPRPGGPSSLQPDKGCDNDEIEIFSPSPCPQTAVSGYNYRSYVDRIGHSAKFVIVRPDLFVFACAKNVEELMECLASMKQRLGNA